MDVVPVTHHFHTEGQFRVAKTLEAEETCEFTGNPYGQWDGTQNSA